MRKFSLLFSFLVMTAMFLFLGGCQREEDFVDEKDQQNLSSAVLDSTILSKFLFKNNGDFNKGSRNGEDLPSTDSLRVICNLILEQDSSHHFLANFLETFGYPDWERSFYFEQYRDDYQVISIPFVKNNSVTGVLQYHSEYGKNGLKFFSNNKVDKLIQDSTLINTNVKILGIVGLGQAKLRCGNSLTFELKKYLQNLRSRSFYKSSGSREETCQIWCIVEIWEYINDEGVVYAEETWACFTYCPGESNGIDFPPAPGFNPDEKDDKNDEPWYEDPDDRSPTGTSPGSNTNNNDTRTWEEIKLDNAKECFMKAGVKSVIADVRLREKAKYLCGTTYNELLKQAYDNMIEVDKDCSDINAVLEMIEDMEKMIDQNTSWVSPVIKAEIQNFLAEGPVDPCTGKPLTEKDITNELCDSPDKSLAAVQEALEGVDYLDNNISDKRLSCLWKKMMNSNNSNNNVVCEQLRYYEGKTKLNLSIWSQEFVGPNQDNASTGIDNNGQVTIQFNENNMKDKCDLEIIKTMIHESVHAGILNIVKGTHANGWGVNDVPDLKYYYDKFTNFHHEYMAGAYFNNLVNSLKQVFGNQYSDEVYEALMWKGLHNTTAYKKLSSDKRYKIESIWKQFDEGSLCTKSCY